MHSPLSPGVKPTDRPTPATSHLNHESWLDSPEARQAKLICGWPDCQPEEFFEALVLVLDTLEAARAALVPALKERGLTYDEFLELVAAVQDSGTDLVGGTAAGRRGVRRLYLAGFDSEHISNLLGLDAEAVQTYLDGKKYSAKGRDVVRLHAAGETVVHIAKQLGISRKDVYRALTDMGVENPNRTRHFLSDAKRARIIELYKAGAAYSAIREQVGVEKHHVTNTLRKAHAEGKLPGYGARR